MKRRSLLNQLELAYSPLTNYEFSILKDDPMIERALEQASIYIIAQRPVLSFENIRPLEDGSVLSFEIHQRNNPHILKCKLPILQEVFGVSGKHEIGLSINLIDKQKIQKNVPFGNAHGFSLIELIDNEKRFLVWFSPEKLLQNFWRDDIHCEIDGDIRKLLNYKVHYVGKATKQSILKRLTGHNTLQDIISLEYPITYNDLPTHEIAILCFEFLDNIEISTFGEKSDIKEMVAAIKGENLPKQEKIFLDAEKALIKAMQPAYNKILFKNYPKSKDGLYDQNYDTVSYTFMDPITLEYELGKIECGTSTIGGDSIFVLDNETFKLIKQK